MSLQIAVTEDELMDFNEPEEETTLQETQKEPEKVQPTEDAEENKSRCEPTIFDVFGLPKDLDVTKKTHDDIRLNTVHVLGVQEMSTNEVLDYFSGLNPSKVEWINDTSCNVVFDDFTSSALS
jgi:hypothetical protein